MEILLPTSTIYDYLEGRIPHPAYTYIKIADIIEAEEKERINREIGERRTRLGARIDQVTLDVKREALESSDLESAYSSIIDWTQDDDIRRKYEEKLLQHAYDTLAVLPVSKKVAKRTEVQKMAQGLVILKHPFMLAWKIVLEWKDAERIEEWDPGLFREFVSYFPDEGLSQVLKGYLGSETSPFPTIVDSTEIQDNEDDEYVPMTAEDRLLLMTEGLEDSSSSIMSHRIMGDYFLSLEEYGSASSTARQALDLVAAESQISGLNLTDTLDGVNIILATALIQYQAPRNHPEARSLLEAIIYRKSANLSALIGIGLILEEQEDYSGAIDFFERALKRNQNAEIQAEAAWCKALSGDYQNALDELQASLPKLKGSVKRTGELKAQSLYRIGICTWNLDSSKAARKDRQGAYAKFLASLQADMNFAPSYTSLGIYYSEYGKDKKRARKCFQKAFELSASEVEAAERLAKAFAEQSEWDLVEVVAQQVVESGKVRPAPGSKKKGFSWPFAALGVVQLNNQDYAKSIVSFQSALRISPDDYHCWIGLGESYYNSGRYIAATKAFEQAQSVEVKSSQNFTESTWFSTYMLANVRRELGEYDMAVAGYKEVLNSRATEFGVSIALLQTMVDSAWRDIELGFFGRAANSATDAIGIAQGIAMQRSDAFNVWKAVGDACSVYSWVQAYAADFPAQDLRLLLECEIDLKVYDLLAEVDGIGKEALESLSDNDSTASGLALCLHAAILSQKRAIYACARDVHAQAVAWYNLGWTEYRAHVCLAEDQRSSSRKKFRKYLKASIRCFKRAIELEAGNSDFWNSLGIVTAKLNPKVSQHAFVRSLFINDKAARVWTNLGTLYLLQSDSQLANDAFTRAQSTDPEYAHAWLGQGLLAAQLGEEGEARTLFTHTFEIADSSSTIVKQQYALASFDHLLSSHSSSVNVMNILEPLFGLHQLNTQVSTDTTYQHLSALFAERVGNYTESSTSLASISSKLEAEYEILESPITLTHFAQAKATLGRVQLAGNDFSSAAKNAETALDISTEGETSEFSPAARRKCRVSAHLTAGLAYYNNGSMDESIIMFRSALEETNGDPDIVCLLAQVLWAKGGEEERNVAREQLFDCVEKHPDHFGAMTLLGVIAILDGDKDTIEAVTADLRSLRTRDSLNAQQQRKIARVIAGIATITPGKDREDLLEIAEATTAVMLAPSQPHGWNQLAELTEEIYPAEVALLTRIRSVPPRGTLDAEDLCRAYAGTNRIGDAQRAIMIAPWKARGWEAFL